MSYLSVVTLQDAKDFLRVDSDNNDDNNQITQMIKSACSLVERRTNHILYARDKNYLFQDYTAYVYDYPINSIEAPSSNVTEKEFELYNIYDTTNSNDTTLTLNVGYGSPSNVPDELKELVLNIVKFYYYEQEENKGSKGKLPIFLEQSMNMLKRFII